MLLHTSPLLKSAGVRGNNGLKACPTQMMGCEDDE